MKRSGTRRDLQGRQDIWLRGKTSISLQMVADCYKLGQDGGLSSREDDGKRRAGLPLCDVTNYELGTSVAHIKVSLGLHNTSYCEADRGEKGISQDFFSQSAGRKWWSCSWLSRCSSSRGKPRYRAAPCVWEEGSYKKTTSMSPSEIWRQKRNSWFKPRLYIIWESRRLPFSNFKLKHPRRTNEASLNGEIVLFLASVQLGTVDWLRTCLFLMPFINYLMTTIAIPFSF